MFRLKHGRTTTQYTLYTGPSYPDTDPGRQVPNHDEVCQVPCGRRRSDGPRRRGRRPGEDHLRGPGYHLPRLPRGSALG
jgi:hypothetical protein